MINVLDYAKSHKVSTDTVKRRIKDGTLKAVLKGGKYFILDVKENKQSKSEKNPLDTSRLKDIKLEAEIKILQMKDKEKQEMIRADERNNIKVSLLKILSEINQGWRECELTKEQCEKIKKHFDSAIKKIATL